jgi:hypothetical protein
VTPRPGAIPPPATKAPGSAAPDAAQGKPPAAARTPPGPIYRGRVRLGAGLDGARITYVVFRLDGRVAQIAERPPFAWEWDTREVKNGPHVVEILGQDDSGTLVARRVVRVRVENAPATPPAPREKRAPSADRKPDMGQTGGGTHQERGDVQREAGKRKPSAGPLPAEAAGSI